MNASVETKVCPMCAETIKAAAKKCPHCQSRQTRFAQLKGEMVGGLFLLVAFVALVFICDRLFSERTPESGFARHRDELPVMRTVLESAGTKPEPWLTGYVTNRGDLPWRVHELEVRFLDAQGKMLDVQHPAFSKTEAFVVPPKQEHAFRVKLAKLSQTDQDAVLAVRVQIASDGNQAFDPD